MNKFSYTTIFLFLFPISVFSQQLELPKKSYQKIDSLFNSYHSKTEPGSIFRILQDGETIYSNALGLANLEYQIPISEVTRFNIASNSKQFTTYLALILEEEGKLSFNDDIREHIPMLAHLPYKITIKQLTNHTHGLPNTDELTELNGEVYSMHNFKVLDILLKIESVNFKPGSRYEYNNTGYVLLAEILERVSKKPFEELLEEKIFKPLGMISSKAIKYTDDIISNKAYSYKKSNQTYIRYPMEFATIGASGIYTSISDLSNWATNFYNQKVGKKDFYTKMLIPTITSSKVKTNYGLGLHKDNYKGIDIVFHGGGTNSYRSYVLHVPKHKLSFICLSNKGNGADLLDVIYKSLEIVLKDEIKETKNEKIVRGKELKKYEGTYEMYPGKYLKFSVKEDNLYCQELGSEYETKLSIVNGNTFKDPVISLYKFVFLDDRLDFYGADIVRNCFKTKIDIVSSHNLDDLQNYTGLYKNKELNAIYELKVDKTSLVAVNSLHKIILKPLSKNSFYSPVYFFSKVDFIKVNNKVTGFKVSGQNLKNILFEKID